VNDCRIAFDVRGNGPAVLFIQGVGVPGCGWKPQVDGLADRFRCVSFDNRGIGGSVPCDGPVTVERMADDAAAVLDAAGIDSAHVVGHSLGGPIAIQLALAHRARVKSLALLCTFANGKAAAPLTPRMLWLGLRSRIGPRRSRRRAFLRLVMPPAALAGVDVDQAAAELAPLFGHDLANQPPIVGKQLRAMRTYDATPRLGELAGLPTVVASAGFDPIAPPKLGRALAAAIPGASFVEYPDESHGLPIRRATDVNRLLADHFTKA
jgi:pimeloyl-ACP methyl ester carboxylesterase